jgi:hypothetical protein
MNREHWKAMLPIITAFANGENVEVFYGGAWVEESDFGFERNPSAYRIAPRIIRIGAFDVPEPYRGEMKEGQRYYYVALGLDDYSCNTSWNNDESDNQRMKRGLIHLTPEAAELHGKALASLTAGEEVKP